MDIIASNEVLDLPLANSRKAKLLQCTNKFANICGSSEIWCKISVWSDKFKVLNSEHLCDGSITHEKGRADVDLYYKLRTYIFVT